MWEREGGCPNQGKKAERLQKRTMGEENCVPGIQIYSAGQLKEMVSSLIASVVSDLRCSNGTP